MKKWYYQVSNSEMSNILQDQGNQGIARKRAAARRTRNPADWRWDYEKGPFLDGH